MIANQLPGSTQPYLLRAGDGERWLMAGQLATVMARHEDTGGLFEAVMLAGGHGAAMPPHRHRRGHELWLVLDGRVTLELGGDQHDLSRGDYASIPSGTVHAYRMTGHRTKVLTWNVGGASGRLCAALGDRYEGFVPPGEPAAEPGPEQWATAEADADTERAVMPAASGIQPVPVSPGTAAPYVVRAGDGQRLLVADQLFTFLGHQGNSGGRFIVLGTDGPRGERIPMHLHQRHTETFFCVDGAMTMWVNGEEVELRPGDFVHVPAGTVHSYRLEAHVTRFVGLLTPGLFEPFFRLLGDPYEPHVFPLHPWPFRFDRVAPHLHELDLTFVEDPRAVPKRGE